MDLIKYLAVVCLILGGIVAAFSWATIGTAREKYSAGSCFIDTGVGVALVLLSLRVLGIL